MEFHLNLGAFKMDDRLTTNGDHEVACGHISRRVRGIAGNDGVAKLKGVK